MTPRERIESFWTRALLPLTGTGLVLGILLEIGGRHELAVLAWALPSVLVAVWLTLSIIRDLMRRHGGVDIIAVLAISGALLLDEYLAAAVIGLMLATGEWLERYAEGRAQRELSALLSRAPQTVRRYENGELVERPIAAVDVGDDLLVKRGEVVPVDGVVTGANAVLDESALTGESRLVVHEVGEQVTSGTVNAGAPFDVRAIATAEDSTYAGIVRLVESAQKERAPFVRLADRYALYFVPLALFIAGLAWLVSGDPVRALSVLVVATPCPLLLAAPIAIVAGISRSAKRGIIIKNGGALEALARVVVLLFDKTGTLTAGRPQLADVVTEPDTTPDEALRLVASLEQASPHVLAASIVSTARQRDIALALPTDTNESPGAGITGRVDGALVAVGTLEFVFDGADLPAWARAVRRRTNLEGATTVWLSIESRVAAVLVLDDPIRPEAPRVIRSLRQAGVTRIAMVTGDHQGVADLVGSAIGVDAVLAERTPSDKVDAVAEERRAADGFIAMVGDGVNDAPALAAADVGVAMGARGATASSEAADVVITVDRLDRLPEAIAIARRSRRIALQSVIAGMAMSIIAMFVASTGVLPPVAGAIVQEAIDVVVILNALRALTGGVGTAPKLVGWSDMAKRMRAEHLAFAPALSRLRWLADRLETLPPLEAQAELESTRDFLLGTLMPHEAQEDRDIFPRLARDAGSDDLTAALHRTHVEIFHLVRLLDRLVSETTTAGPEPEDLTDLRRVLYGLDAILRLHMAQEDELYATLADEAPLVNQPINVSG